MQLSWAILKKLFENHLDNRSFSRSTITRYLREAEVFFEWLAKERGKDDAREVTREDIFAYRLYLHDYERKGKRLRDTTRRGMVMTVRRLFLFLAKYEYLLTNPFDGIDLGNVTVRHLRTSIPEERMHRLLDGIEGTRMTRIRDRALFELLYGTGLRSGEVCRLDLADVDFAVGTLFVRQGKGGKDRVVPLGANAMRWLELYIAHARPKFGMHRKGGLEERDALFLTLQGRRMSWVAVNAQLKQHYVKSAPEGKKEKQVCAHMLRHSFATHVLEGGAAVKQVKDILGHACFESTVIYTHFSVKGLRRIMKRYHPRENELFTEMTDEERERIVRLLRCIADDTE
ncbi:MAG TPA: tyrosine-type recombinase/integrase [Spirochaetota bacterium]|nr:tyrosine-type recombinase/integrase [Spirochaetota bacterium]